MESGAINQYSPAKPVGAPRIQTQGNFMPYDRRSPRGGMDF